MRKKLKISCIECGCEFEKNLSEIKRSENKGMRHFCSRKCVGKHSRNWYNPDGDYYDVSKHCNNMGDEYTKFRYHYRNIKRRNKNIDITMDDLNVIWEEQQGICPFTGVKLNLSEYNKVDTNILTSASLDRIDSSKGYIKGNVRWVSRSINLMKSDRTDDVAWEICRVIYENYKKINHPENQDGLL